MNDRKQFVAIDTFCSNNLTHQKCCVVQGSKLSTALYTLYLYSIKCILILPSSELHIAILLKGGCRNILSGVGLLKVCIG